MSRRSTAAEADGQNREQFLEDRPRCPRRNPVGSSSPMLAYLFIGERTRAISQTALHSRRVVRNGVSGLPVYPLLKLGLGIVWLLLPFIATGIGAILLRPAA
jgi:hypothetical protein